MLNSAPEAISVAARRPFTTSVDQVCEREWNDLISLFEDASLYQTWAYGAVSWGGSSLSHLLLKEDDRVVGMAQFRIVRVPLLSSGIAYLRWGPLFRRRDADTAEQVLPELMRAISDEYGRRRRLLIRILPNAFRVDPTAPVFETAAARSGFKAGPGLDAYRTFRVDLSPPLEIIRKRLDQKWRNQLNGAERNGLQVLEGTSDELFARFAGIYRELLARKQFDTTVDIDEFARIQRALPEPLKMRVLLAEKEGSLVAGLVGSGIGDTGIYLLGATSSEGMKAKGSYLLQWRMMQWLRQQGCRWYDLGGINPERNPGVYHFKAGLGGLDVLQVNPIEASGSRWSNAVVATAEKIKRSFSSVRAMKSAPPARPVGACRTPQAATEL